jgi:AbrB family looped-hinge helix DNA binding protein
MNILGIAKVYANRIWIPKNVREKLSIRDGDLVYFYENDENEIVIKKSGKKFEIK